MPCYIRRLFQLCKDVLGKDFTKLNSHLIYDRKKIIMMSRQRKKKKKKKLPNELIPQITPCTKILCSYNAINAPTNKNKNKKVKSNIQEKKKGEKESQDIRTENSPKVAGVKSGNMILVLGLLPANTLLFTKTSGAPSPNSFLTCSSVFPNAKASG